MNKRALTKLWTIFMTLSVISIFTRSVNGAESDTISFESLLEEMVDRDCLGRLPSPAYTCKQFSSYDRNSTKPGSTTWWANWDRSYFVRIEDNNGRKEHVLMDADGPGAIVRFWATWHGPGGKEFSNGTLRVYIDKKAEPVIEGPMADLISGGKLVGEPLSQGVSPETAFRHRGHNLYLPIPYAKHCKVTYETKSFIDEGARKGEALYYQINYRSYEKQAKVESFTRDSIEQAHSTLDRVQQMLGQNERTGLDRTKVDILKGSIAPSKEKMITIKGQKAIRSLEFQLQADDLAQALRSTVIKIEFDDNTTVWCPIGDFFGTGYHIRPHSTWYTSVSSDNILSCYWIMPFKNQSKIQLLNLGSQPVRLTRGRILSSPWEWDDRSCYFHTTWKQWAGIETQSNGKAKDHGAFDLNWISIEGRGHYVGDVLILFNTANTWWGEGDEKIYVNGESFPSHIGTGTEDYYGYAWCKPDFFESAFHAQPSGDGNLKPGFTVNVRYRSLDAIPFNQSIRFDMELWHWARTTMNYAPTTFWYARPGATWDVEPNPKEAKRPVPRSVEDIIKPRLVENAMEGETLPIVKRSGGVTEIQNIPRFHWSNNRQLWWRNAKEKDELTIEFPVEQAGDYDLILGITKAVDYGIVRIDINSQTMAESLDLYNSTAVATEVKLGVSELRRGKNTLKVTILGANPSAVKSYMFGLDYILAIEPGGVADEREIPIWTSTAPGSARSTLNEKYHDRPITNGTSVTRDRSVTGVSQPTLTVYLPTQEKATGAAVIICPGGGFSHLAIDKEGHDVARWLQSHGIAGAVVKYRLPDPEVGLYVPNGSISDMQRAIRIVRRNAGKWNIDPGRIGVMGFSAGGYMAAAAGTLFDRGDPDAVDPIQRISCRPDFIVPVYPLISLELQGKQTAGLLERMLGPRLNDKFISEYSLETRVTSQTPPTFLVHAHDDGLSVEHSILFYLALGKAKVPAELHIYSKGGHGFGMRQRGRPVSSWRERWLEWMKAEGFLQQP